MRVLLASSLIAAVLAAPAGAQLLSERVEGDRRICDYVGSDRLADGQVLPRVSVLAVGQPCPATAPFRDPNGTIPGNAGLTGEVARGDGRECRYSQGGVDYILIVPVAQPCAQTPDLLRAANGR